MEKRKKQNMKEIEKIIYFKNEKKIKKIKNIDLVKINFIQIILNLYNLLRTVLDRKIILNRHWHIRKPPTHRPSTS